MGIYYTRAVFVPLINFEKCITHHVFTICWTFFCSKARKDLAHFPYLPCFSFPSVTFFESLFFEFSTNSSDWVLSTLQSCVLIEAMYPRIKKPCCIQRCCIYDHCFLGFSQLWEKGKGIYLTNPRQHPRFATWSPHIVKCNKHFLYMIPLSFTEQVIK